MPEPGLTLTTTGAVGGTIQLDGQSPAEFWRDVATSDAFQRALVDAVREHLTGTHHSKRSRTLQEAGATAADGGYATVVAGLDRAPDDDRHESALQLTANLGQSEPTILGHRPLEDVRDGPVALIDASSHTPTLAVRIHDGFQEVRADQRRRICELLSWLAQTVDLRIVATGRLQWWLVQEHRADLPGGVSEQCTTFRPQAEATPDVDEARLELNYDSREVQILRDLVDEVSETLSYHALKNEHGVARSRISQVVNRLADLGLVATFDGGDRGRCVELLADGRELVKLLDAEIGRQQSLGTSVSGTGQPSGSPVFTDRAHGGTAQPEAVAASAGRFDAAFLSRWHHASAVGSTATADVTTVDAQIEAYEDAREPGWSYDDGELVVSVEAGHSALQLWTRFAFGLANWRTFEYVLTPDVLEEIIEEHPKAILWGARNVGYLKDEYDTGEQYRDALLDAAESLRQLTKKRHHGEFTDREQGASIITKDALGLTTLLVHLLDLADVEVIREVRIPDCSRNYDGEDLDELARSIAIGLSQQSTYGEHVAWRHLYEDREDRRNAALGVDVDAADPLGGPIGSWVVVGDGADAMLGPLRRAIRSPADLHDDAPEFAVSVQLGEPGRPAFAMTAKRVLEAKNLNVTREAVSVLEAFTSNPYDAARAVNYLQVEDYPEDVRLDEIRYALASLEPDRLLPEAPPTMSKIVRAMLTATQPLTQAELAERADVSTRSVRRHADRLEAFDLVRETTYGYRLSLSHRGERHRDVLPWYATPNIDRDDVRDATVKGVLWEVIEQLDTPDDEAVMDALEEPVTIRLPPDNKRKIREAWGWSRPFLDVVEALAAEEQEYRQLPVQTVQFGAEIEQASLTATDQGGLVG